jgi:hypothetical protein
MTIECKCGHTQEVNEKNVYQDIRGKFTFCESCNAPYDVEIKDKEYE